MILFLLELVRTKLVSNGTVGGVFVYTRIVYAVRPTVVLEASIAHKTAIDSLEINLTGGDR